MIDKSCAVIGYASGQNEQSFMQLIDNGMFNMDEAIIVDLNDGSDNNNEVLGAVLDMGMPITREDTPGNIPSEDNQIETTLWDPFQHGGVIAPEGVTYFGKAIIPLFWSNIEILCINPIDGRPVESYC